MIVAEAAEEESCLTLCPLKQRHLSIIHLFLRASLLARAPLALAALLPLPLMQALAHFLLVALVVEPEQAGQHLAAGSFADGEAYSLRRLVEAV
jgi:hypothetical protein